MSEWESKPTKEGYYYIKGSGIKGYNNSPYDNFDPVFVFKKQAKSKHWYVFLDNEDATPVRIRGKMMVAGPLEERPDD